MMTSAKYSIFLLLFYWIPIQAQLFESSNLPILLIETSGQEILDEPKVMAQMELIYNGPGQRNFLTDPPNEYNGWIGIELRGATSQELFDKKSYAVETRNDLGENRNVSLLGMPAENDWVLHGPYSDKSLMRNALAYEIGASIMEYAPRTHFVEMVLNGNYHGVYLLTEKIKRDKNRVNISKLKPDITSGDELTGGYILKIDKEAGAKVDGFLVEHDPTPGALPQTSFQYHYPKQEDLNSAQENYIQNFIKDFEKTLAEDDFSNPTNGYQKYIDVSTFIDFFLINELVKNADAYRLSTFMYKDRNSIDPRLKIGPLWDFNIAFGNVDACINGTPEGWVKDYNETCAGNVIYPVPFWWKKLWKDKKFRSAVKERWEELRKDQLSDQVLFTRIENKAEELAEAQKRNFERWPVLSKYVWHNWFVGDTYEEEIDYLTTWLEKRIEWMEQQMLTIENPTFYPEDYFEPHVYPNPFQSELIFECYLQEFEPLRIDFFNVQGQLLVQHVDANPPNGLVRFSLDAQYLTPGIYFYKIWINGEQRTAQKVVKGF